jgi:MSHA type pilus biogenesis protein MshL
MFALNLLKPARLGGQRLALSALALSLLAGCAGTPPRSVKSLNDPDHEAVQRMREVAAAESMKLLANQEMIQREMRRETPAPELKPQEPKFDPLEGKLITVAMSKASISQILAAFADSAKINLIVDPAVIREGMLSDMYLRGVSLREAFAEVLRSYDVSGEIKGNTLRVALNEEKFFSLDFLNTTTNLDMSTGGNVFGGGNAGSNALRGNLSLSGAGGTKTDPYAEIEGAIKAILGENQRRTPTSNFAPSASSPQALAATAPGAGGVAGGNAQPAAPSMFNAALDLAEGEKSDSAFSLNKMTGTLYVKARPAKMRAIEKMLARAQGMLRKQVYIEAQLIDVQLSDNFEFGVDWSILRGQLAANFGATPMALASTTSTLTNAGNAFPTRTVTIPSQFVGSQNGQSLGIGYQGSTSGVVINALRSFGNLRVLSNPNVQVRNGTPALLSVGSSYRYVARTTSSQTAPGGGATTTTSDVQTDSVFSGVMVGVLPFMREDGRIELLVNPMQSDVDQKSLQLVAVNDTNRVTLPVVSYKGLTTTLNVGDGDVVVIGGLIDQRTSGSDKGAPGVSDVPLFGKLFGNQADSHASRELVVVLRVRVL